MMINTRQTWSEKARMQINAEKTKVMCFETTQVRNARKKPRTVQGQKLWPAECEILRPSTFFTLPSLHLRCFSSSDPTGQSQQVSQHHNACLWPSHSATCRDRYPPPVHNTEHATCATQIWTVFCPTCHYSTFSLATMAASVATCALVHNRNPYAHCNMPRGHGYPCGNLMMKSVNRIFCT